MVESSASNLREFWKQELFGGGLPLSASAEYPWTSPAGSWWLLSHEVCFANHEPPRIHDDLQFVSWFMPISLYLLINLIIILQSRTALSSSYCLAYIRSQWLCCRDIGIYENKVGGRGFWAPRSVLVWKKSQFPLLPYIYRGSLRKIYLVRSLE